MNLEDSHVEILLPPKRRYVRTSLPDLADKGATQTSSDAKAIWTKYPPKSVHLASAQVYRHQGHHDAAFVVQEVAKDPANLGPKIREFISNPRPEPKRMSIDELTAMHLRNDLTKKQFQDLTSTFNSSVFESLGINVSIK